MNQRISFQAKILIPVTVILVLLMAITTWVVDRRITQQFEKEARQRLETSEAVFKAFQGIRSENLLSRYRNLANEPRLKAISGTVDTNTVQDFFSKEINNLAAQKLGADVILFISENLERPVVFNLDRAMNLVEFETNVLVLVQQVSKEPVEGIVSVGERLFSVVCIPIEVSGYTAGVITFANEIGVSVAHEFRQLTGSEIVFFSNERVLVSTLANEQQKEFNEHLQKFPVQGSNAKANSEIMLDGKHFFWRANHFKTAQGDTEFNYVLLSSYEDAWQMLQQTQRTLLWVRIVGLGLAALILWTLIRKVTRPLQELRDGAEAVGRGDFSHHIKVSSRDEFGDLAASFNQMTTNVKNSREQLEKTVETLKTTRAQLVQSEKLSAIGEFVAGVAHELNNPLTAVIGFAELLHQSEGDETHKNFSRRIVQSAERCHKIVQNLLSFARQHTPERKKANLNSIVESVVDILMYELRTSNIQIVKNLEENLPPLLADAHQLQQVFLNIINNARQAMEGQANASIHISTKSLDNRVTVTFQDNGPGISEENLAKIFNPFFTTKPVGKGTGLGLSLSYGIIQEHGGNIRANSKLGEGTAFMIEFPVTQEDLNSAPAKADSSQQASLDGNGKRVLVIDDEEPILQLVREVLGTCGYDVETAPNGELGLRYLAQKSYDLVVCDLKMPGLGGRQIYEQLLASNPAMAKRMIFMTGDGMSERTQQFLKENNKVCLSKPFSLQEFRMVVNQASASRS